jgi:hypothetical protein
VNLRPPSCSQLQTVHLGIMLNWPLTLSPSFIFLCIEPIFLASYGNKGDISIHVPRNKTEHVSMNRFFQNNKYVYSRCGTHEYVIKSYIWRKILTDFQIFMSYAIKKIILTLLSKALLHCHHFVIPWKQWTNPSGQFGMKNECLMRRYAPAYFKTLQHLLMMRASLYYPGT